MKIEIEIAKIVNVVMRDTAGNTELFPVDVSKMSNAALVLCLSNGIQRRCNDTANSTAAGFEGKEKDAVKRATILAQVEKLESKAFAVGSRGSSVDIWTREARNYLASLPKIKAAIADMKAGERNETLDGLIEKHRDAIKADVDARVAAFTATPDLDIEL